MVTHDARRENDTRTRVITAAGQAPRGGKRATYDWRSIPRVSASKSGRGLTECIGLALRFL